MKILSFITIVLLTTLVSCKTKDPSLANGTSGHIITIDARTLKMNTSLSYWVSVADRSGKTLSVRHVLTRDTLHLNSNTSDTLVTATYYALDNTGFSNIVTYGGIQVNSTISFNPSLQSSSDYGGNNVFYLMFRNMPAAFYPYSYSSPIDMGGAIADQYEFPIWLSDVDTTSILLSTYSPENVPLYKWVHDVKSGDHDTVDYGSFVPYQKTIPVSFDGNLNSYSIGYQVGGTDATFFNYTFGSMTGPRALGYLEGFQNYLLNAQGIVNSSMTSSYSKFGAVPASVTIPHFVTNVTFPIVEQFGFTIDRSYTYSTALFTSANSQWTVNSPPDYLPVVGKIPAAIVSRFPLVNPAKFTFWTVSAIERMDGLTYTGFVNLSMGSIGKDASYEYYSYDSH